MVFRVDQRTHRQLLIGGVSSAIDVDNHRSEIERVEGRP